MAEGRGAAGAGHNAEVVRALAVLEASSWEEEKMGKEFPYCLNKTVEICDWMS